MIDTLQSTQPRAIYPFISVSTCKVLIAIFAGMPVGPLLSGAGIARLGDVFIELVKMLIAPVILLTVATGIAGTAELKKVDRVAGKALIYSSSSRRSQLRSA